MKIHAASFFLWGTWSCSSAHGQPASELPRQDAEAAQISDEPQNLRAHQRAVDRLLDDDGDESADFIIKYRDNVGRQFAKAFGKDDEFKVELGRDRLAVINLKRSLRAQLARNPHIEFVEENYEVNAFGDQQMLRGSISSRTLVEDNPYGLTMVQADQLQPGAAAMKICIVDTGYGLGHPDLPSTGVEGMIPVEYPNDQTWDFDPNSHGTHVAGTIGAIGGNGVGVSSILNDESKFSFFIAKGLRDNGSGTISGVIQAIQGCKDAGANIINMSLGCNGSNCSTSTAFNDKIRQVTNEGVLVIASAGNSGGSIKSYPASFPDVMSVAAVDSNRNVPNWSQRNDQIEIAAPGVSVLSTITVNYGDTFSYRHLSGTSMAAPHVSGVAALVWSHFPHCTNNQIRNVLVRTATHPKVNEGCDVEYGRGIVQAKDAYDLLAAGGCDAAGGPSVAPTNTIDPSNNVGGCEQDPLYTYPPTDAPSLTPTATPTTSPSPTEGPTVTPTSAPSPSPSSAPTCEYQAGLEDNAEYYIRSANTDIYLYMLSGSSNYKVKAVLAARTNREADNGFWFVAEKQPMAVGETIQKWSFKSVRRSKYISRDRINGDIWAKGKGEGSGIVDWELELYETSSGSCYGFYARHLDSGDYLDIRPSNNGKIYGNNASRVSVSSKSDANIFEFVKKGSE